MTASFLLAGDGLQCKRVGEKWAALGQGRGAASAPPAQGLPLLEGEGQPWGAGSKDLSPVPAAEVPDDKVGSTISVTVELAYKIGLAHSL